MTDLKVPGIQYHRPGGSREYDFLIIPNAYTVDRKNIIQVLQNQGIDITFEFVFGGTVNVCLDNGDFDYKSELVKNGPPLFDCVLKLIDDFDYEDYVRAKDFEDRMANYSYNED